VLHHVQQPLDVAALEPAHVRRVVHVARRRPDEDQPLEALRLAVGREHAHHAAHRVRHEDHVAQVEGVHHVQHVLRVPVERGVAGAVVRGEVALPRAHVVEQHHPVVVFERRRHEAPHVLVAPEAVREEHGLRAAPRDADVVAREDVVGHGVVDRLKSGDCTATAC
jgi:hypothetical protein